MIKSGVIGWPVAHSRSPLIHGYWLKQFGIAGTYDRVPLTPENLSDFIANLVSTGWAGCNVTIPHKETAIKHVVHVDDRARRIGAVNTIYVRNGELHATSTDGVGFCRNVEDACANFSWTHKRIIVLGAGGSACAIIDEVLRRGAHSVTICNRTPARAQSLVTRFGDKTVAQSLASAGHHFSSADMLINTTSLGRGDTDSLELPLHGLPPHAIVADINYVPLKTRLIRDAENMGLQGVTGLGMLLHQAVPGFELWFGRKPAVTPDLYDLVARDIDPEYRTR